MDIIWNGKVDNRKLEIERTRTRSSSADECQKYSLQPYHYCYLKFVE
jgi:hypothetical protein